MPGLFVTGTDTGVGKTVVTAALLAALRRRGADVAAYKPCETGVDDPAAWPPDGRFLAAAAGTGESLDRTVPVRLRAPAAPLVAAANEGRHLDPAALVAGYHRLARDHAIVLAEG
ncbi:MAG: dethiobiotin synthase, partial [Clostridia bacterium]|nr:dethiobiotin synthase [Clostridia bacterium]